MLPLITNHFCFTLEGWFTNLEQTALNHYQPLPTPYKRLLTGNSNTLFIIHFATHSFA